MEKKEYHVITKEVLIKMWEGEEKATNLLNALSKSSAQEKGRPIFGTEAKAFIASLKEATQIDLDALSTFLRYARIDCLLKDKDNNDIFARLNN